MPGTPTDTKLDPAAMESALVNLLENALKYTPTTASNREVELALQKTDQYAVLEVRDRGVGIPAAEHGKIFTSFYRARSGKQVIYPVP